VTVVAAAQTVVLGLLALLAVQALANTRRVGRLRAMPVAGGPRVAVLVPARNEAARIGAAVAAWLGQTHEPFDLVVYDDDSTDGTAAAALAASGGDPRLRVVAGGALPPGWRGKPHACHRLRAATEADVLVFADADVVPAPDALARTVGALATTGAAVVSALPRHESRGAVMRALVGLQGWAALALVPWWLAGRCRAPALAVLNGQYLAIPAPVYDAAGGFAAVRDSLAEDVALGRRLAALGHRLVFLDGAGVLTCRPYATFAECWEANVRNLGAVLLRSSALALGGAAALALLHVVPAVSLVAGGVGLPGWPWWPCAALALGLLPRRLADRRAGRGAGTTLLHPLAVAVLAAMMLESWRRARLGRTVEWRGRHYRMTTGAGAG
jgi:cellulose synthase/poly-beta-1,6-N-acetylglucosamine synthase-like glycosyltransferase